jgi:hypothetical protein
VTRRPRSPWPTTAGQAAAGATTALAARTGSWWWAGAAGVALAWLTGRTYLETRRLGDEAL